MACGAALRATRGAKVKDHAWIKALSSAGTPLSDDGATENVSVLATM